MANVPGPVLVVADDEAPIRLVVAEKLRSAGFTIYEAQDGEEALALALKHRPVGLITDLQMPYMNGLELAMRLRASDTTSAIPVLLLTARGHILSDEQLARTNIRKVMSKPFGVRELLNFVQTRLLVRGEPASTVGVVGSPSMFVRSEAA